MSRDSHRKRAAAVVAAVRGQALLPVAPSCVPTAGRHSDHYLVPAHYRETRDGSDERHVFVATALDAGGNEAHVLVAHRDLTHLARRMFRRAGLPAPKREYEPIFVPKETWSAYERLVPEDWFPTANDPHVFGVRGAMPESVVGRVVSLSEEEVDVPLAPRVATFPGGRCLPMFRLVLRDVVRVQTVHEFDRERGEPCASEGNGKRRSTSESNVGSCEA